jgi:hypothetical protein
MAVRRVPGTEPNGWKGRSYFRELPGMSKVWLAGFLDHDVSNVLGAFSAVGVLHERRLSQGSMLLEVQVVFCFHWFALICSTHPSCLLYFFEEIFYQFPLIQFEL